MDLLLAFAAGALTLLNPCVLPVLPVVLASALRTNALGPAVLAAGMSVSFVALGVLVTAFGHSMGLTPDLISQIGGFFMLLFGAILLVPRAGAVFATATAGLGARADVGMDRLDRDGLAGQFVGGLLLGAVWSPCIGPTLGAAVALASLGERLGWVTAVMSSFALGVSAVMLALAYGTRSALQRRQAALRTLSVRARPIMGAVFIVVGLAILFELHHVAEAWAIRVLPVWFQNLSISI